MSVPSDDDARTTTSGGEGVSSAPDVRPENNLKGFQCPSCGQFEEFKVTAEVVITLQDSGIVDESDHEWHDYSTGECPRCNHVNNASVFFLGPGTNR